jgi:hypothetical protein
MGIPTQAPIIRSASGRRPPATRSAVTNGRRLHVVAPGDTRWARRFADVLSEVVCDLGGADVLSEGQRQIARRCATISIACERMEGEAAAGNQIDLDAYGTLTDRLGRAFGRLGLKRQARDVTPSSLAEYLARQDVGRSVVSSEDEPSADATCEETPASEPTDGEVTPDAHGAAPESEKVTGDVPTAFEPVPVAGAGE